MARSMIAYCGINCAKCPAYRLPRLGEKLHMKGLFQWLLKNRMRSRLEGCVVCDGCTAIDARCVKHCLTCPVRCCAMESGVENCAVCGKFPCEHLHGIWKVTAFRDAQPRLEKFNAGRRKGASA